MRVFIAGAGGAIGGQLVPQLVERGHDVVASTRSSRKHEEIRALGAEPVLMDGLDAASVGDAIADAAPEVVVHQMTALGGSTDLRHFDRSFALTNRLRTEGTDHLLAAASAAGARRLVAQSYTGWPNARGPRGLQREDDPLDPAPPSQQRESLAAIRHLERAVLDAAPLEGVVLRYGSFYGPGTSLDGELADMVRARKLPVVGGGSGVWSFIHIADAAAATVTAVESGPQGIFDIVDDEPAPVAEWLPYLAARLGAKPPRRIPSWLARPLIGEVGVSMMTRISGSSNAKAKRELGFAPRYASWRNGFPKAA
jgi:nucleoside-diphosphate-sugar epimerase